MRHFDPAENDQRIRAGLIAVVANRTIEFAKENTNLIAVFDEPFTKYSGGRVLLFQEYVYELTGSIPQFIKSVPACIKIFFSLDIEENDRANHVLAALQSEESMDKYRSLGISQVQFKGQIITPAP